MQDILSGITVCIKPNITTILTSLKLLNHHIKKLDFILMVVVGSVTTEAAHAKQNPNMQLADRQGN